MFISVTNILEPFLSSVIYCNRQEKCDVRLPWQQDLGISTHNYLSWQRLSFALSNDRTKVWAPVLFLSLVMHRKVMHVNSFFFLCHIGRINWFVEIKQFCYQGNVMYICNDFSSLLKSFHTIDKKFGLKSLSLTPRQLTFTFSNKKVQLSFWTNLIHVLDTLEFAGSFNYNKNFSESKAFF